MTEQFNNVLWCKQQSNVTDMLEKCVKLISMVVEKLCEVDKCVSQINFRKSRARQALIRTIFLEMYIQYSVLSVTFLLFHIHTHKYANYFHIFVSLWWYLHNWLIHVHVICSSTYMYMKNVNDVTGWLSQTTDISKYFVWSPGLWDKESRLYLS